MNKANNVHPGEVLNEEFLLPLGITPGRLAEDIGVPQTRIGEIIKGERGISPDTAIRLSRYFGMSAQFWLNLQGLYDLKEAQNLESNHLEYANIRPHDESKKAAKQRVVDGSPGDSTSVAAPAKMTITA